MTVPSQRRFAGGPTGIFAIALLGLLIRIAYAVTSVDFYCPDELYQLLEPAHRIVYGYGFIPWEFRFGARSWIAPGFIAGILYALKAIGITEPTGYVPGVRLVLACLSVSCIFSVYRLARCFAAEPFARLAALFAAVWYELIYFAPRPLSEVLGAYLLLGGLALAAPQSGRQAGFWAGALIGLSVAVRLQLAPLVPAVMLFVLFKGSGKALLKFCLGAAAAAVLAGLVDTMTWGVPFISYYKYWAINRALDLPTLFGAAPAYFYLELLARASFGLLLLGFLVALWQWRRAWLILALIGIHVGVHSLVDHKEYRFLFPAIPLALIGLAVAGETVLGRIRRDRWRWAATAALVAAVAAVSLAGAFRKVPLQGETQIFSGFTEDATRAYLDLFGRDGVEAVFDATTPAHKGWAWTSGYYHLHREIPIYVIPRGYYEMSDRARLWFSTVASHALVDAGTRDLPGFRTIARYGSVEVRRRTGSSRPVKPVRGWSRNVRHRGIDDNPAMEKWRVK